MVLVLVPIIFSSVLSLQPILIAWRGRYLGLSHREHLPNVGFTILRGAGLMGVQREREGLQVSVLHMEVGKGARKQDAARVLRAVQLSARHMVEGGGAST